MVHAGHVHVFPFPVRTLGLVIVPFLSCYEALVETVLSAYAIFLALPLQGSNNHDIHLQPQTVSLL